MRKPKKPGVGISISEVAAAFVPEEAIRKRAYELYEQGGRVDGHALEDWLAAEGELQLNSKTTTH